MKTLKSSKLVVASSSLSSAELEQMKAACASVGVPFLLYDGTSVKLGAIAGKPFPVKVISVRTPGEADLGKLLSTTDEAQGSPQQKA
jgi:ribosomal protein L30E